MTEQDFDSRWQRVLEFNKELLGEDVPKDWIISQHPEEARLVYDKIAVVSAKTFLEIGSQHGASLYLYAGALSGKATVASIDAGEKKNILRAMMAKIEAEGFVTQLCAKMSNSAEAYSWAMSLFGPRNLDVLHIDGCHTADMVRSDWVMYSPLVRPGGLVLIHDIAEISHGVPAFWKSIKDSGKYKCWETVHTEKMGMGIVEMV